MPYHTHPHTTTLSPQPTCTLGLCPEGGSRCSGASLQGPGEQHADLVLGVGVQVANLVRGLVHKLQVIHAPAQGPVLHLTVHDGAVAIDGVGIQLDPQVGGAHRCQLGRGDGNGGLWGVGEEGGQKWKFQITKRRRKPGYVGDGAVGQGFVSVSLHSRSVKQLNSTID